MYDFASAQYEKENYFQAFTIGNEAKIYFEKVLANDNSNPDYLLRRIFPFGITMIPMLNLEILILMVILY